MLLYQAILIGGRPLKDSVHQPGDVGAASPTRVEGLRWRIILPVSQEFEDLLFLLV
jgi:hypothetical protein